MSIDPKAMAAATEKVRVAIRDGWQQGCSRVCDKERPGAYHNVCSCREMAALVARALLAGEGNVPVIRDLDVTSKSAGSAATVDSALSPPPVRDGMREALESCLNFIEASGYSGGDHELVYNLVQRGRAALSHPSPPDGSKQ